MQLGYDSSIDQPTGADAAALAVRGVRWWGVYVGGPSAYATWPEASISNLLTAGIGVLPIWVPNMSLSTSPATEAQMAMAAATVRRVRGVVALDTESSMSNLPQLRSWVDGWATTIQRAGWVPVIYSGAGYCPRNVADWRPLWGSTIPPTPGNAIQYGPTQVLGLSVDANLASNSFPLVFPRSGPPTPVKVPHRKDRPPMLVAPDGKVYAVSPDNHLLVFTPANNPAGWTVDDVTDALAGAFPGSGPYLVQP